MRANYQANTTPVFRVLSEDQIEAIYYAALHIMREVGARVYDEKAVEVYRG